MGLASLQRSFLTQFRDALSEFSAHLRLLPGARLSLAGIECFLACACLSRYIRNTQSTWCSAIRPEVFDHLLPALPRYHRVWDHRSLASWKRSKSFSMTFRALERGFAQFEESAKSESIFLAVQLAFHVAIVTSHPRYVVSAYIEHRLRLPKSSNACLACYSLEGPWRREAKSRCGQKVLPRGPRACLSSRLSSPSPLSSCPLSLSLHAPSSSASLCCCCHVACGLSHSSRGNPLLHLFRNSLLALPHSHLNLISLASHAHRYCFILLPSSSILTVLLAHGSTLFSSKLTPLFWPSPHASLPRSRRSDSHSLRASSLMDEPSRAARRVLRGRSRCLPSWRPTKAPRCWTPFGLIVIDA